MVIYVNTTEIELYDYMQKNSGYFFEPGLQPANYSSIFETLGLETPAWRENLCILIIPGK